MGPIASCLLVIRGSNSLPWLWVSNFFARTCICPLRTYICPLRAIDGCMLSTCIILSSFCCYLRTVPWRSGYLNRWQRLFVYRRGSWCMVAINASWANLLYKPFALYFLFTCCSTLVKAPSFFFSLSAINQLSTFLPLFFLSDIKHKWLCGTSLLTSLSPPPLHES